MTLENSQHQESAAVASSEPETLLDSITLLKTRVNEAKSTVAQFNTSLQAANVEIQQLKLAHADAITAVEQERDQIAAERDEMHDRLESIVSRLRLMGLEHSRYE